MAASSNSWAFSFRFKSTKKRANHLPQEFKTRAQELSFFAHVLDHESDTIAGKRESAEWLGPCAPGASTSPDYMERVREQSSPGHCCPRKVVNSRQQK